MKLDARKGSEAAAKQYGQYLEDSRDNTLGSETLAQVLDEGVHDGVQALHTRCVDRLDGLDVMGHGSLHGAVVPDVQTTRGLLRFH
jgi:hypothetical protein